MRRLLASLLVGLVMGLGLMYGHTARLLDQLHLENESLRLRLEEVQAKYEKLDQSLKQQSRRRLRSIKVSVEGGDDFARVEAEKHVRALYKELLGTPVDDVNPWLVFKAVDGRTLQVQKSRFRIRAQAALIDQELVLYLLLEEPPLTPAPDLF